MIDLIKELGVMMGISFVIVTFAFFLFFAWAMIKKANDYDRRDWK